jgi:hypothetical protein
MFLYSDPSGTRLLEREGALLPYRMAVQRLDRHFGAQPHSAYVPRDAFLELSEAVQPAVAPVSWIAFPRTAVADNETIDAERFDRQDEYVEWHTERDGEGNVLRVTFTTDFPEYYQALASVGVGALTRGIQETLPGAAPSAGELFGSAFNPEEASPEERAEAFREHLRENPWNDGQKGILCLTQGSNTLGALFGLVSECARARPGTDPGAACADAGGACVPDRNSDPVVCQACQALAQSGRALSLEDPVGVRILRLRGIWKIAGRPVDLNDPGSNGGAWTISRNGRRAVLDVSLGVTLGDDPITSGAQVSTELLVAADVISAPEASLPAWARTGHESTRRI